LVTAARQVRFRVHSSGRREIVLKLPSGRIYLDCNATTPLAGAVATVLATAQRGDFGNPSSAYEEGRTAKAALENGRRSVAALIGCHPDEVIFTGSATEADHLAMASALGPAMGSAIGSAGGRKRVLLSAIEHPAVYDQRHSMEAQGFQVEILPVTSEGVLDLRAFDSLMDGDVALVAVLAAHNETGSLQPLDDVGRSCERHGAFFLTDAVQALGKVPSPWSTARPHYLAAAAHKLYGPKGIGALAARRGAPLRPMLVGGGQEGGRRSSTEAVPLAVAFGAACELAAEKLAKADGVRVLRDLMEARLKADWGAVIHAEGAPRLTNTSFFSLPGVTGTEVAAALDRAGVAISTGSACHSGSGLGPRVLKAMGVSQSLMDSVLRVSLGRDTLESDVLQFLDRLSRVLEGTR
jgi:cysteine desulfurase